MSSEPSNSRILDMAANLKVRRAALIKFLADYEGYDLTEPEKVSKLVLTEGDC